MRPLLLVLALVLVGCGEDAAPETEAPAPADGGAAMSCIDGVMYEGTLYAATGETELPPAGDELEGGTRPACNDTGGEPAPDEPVVLREVEGIDPSEAVYADDRPGVLYASGPLP